MKDMPMFTTYYHDKDGYRGYKVWKHPLCLCKSFTSKTIPMEKLKANCLEFLAKLEGKAYIKVTRTLPVGIFKPTNRDGYMVYFKVNKKKYKTYINNQTEELSYNAAVKWLHDKKAEVNAILAKTSKFHITTDKDNIHITIIDDTVNYNDIVNKLIEYPNINDKVVYRPGSKCIILVDPIKYFQMLQ